MSKENYRRIMMGYNPRDPATIGEQVFYVLWCFRCGLEIMGRRIWRRSPEKSGERTNEKGEE